jgi:hypothetical protein
MENKHDDLLCLLIMLCWASLSLMCNLVFVICSLTSRKEIDNW